MVRKLIFGIILSFSITFGSFSQPYPEASPERMESRIIALSQFGKNDDGGVDRVAYSDADIAGRKYIMSEMRKQGLTNLHIDVGGNIIGRRPGSDNSLKPILIGSHTDSVPGGGKYADIIAVKGDVLRYMNLLQRVDLVMKNGVLYKENGQAIESAL